MSETKDSAIKLFGKTIPLQDIEPGESQCCDEAPSCDRKSDINQDDVTHAFTSHETKDPNETSLTDDNPKTPNTENESPNTPNTEEEKDETTNSQENKTLKKPDKILPCPRCKSMETKFCYFNNYNVTQPRYFCKKCQRYWTAGGTMRNVPVGAGRRKNKNSVPHYRHVRVSEALEDPRLGSHYPIIRPNGTILTFRNGFQEPVDHGILEKTIQDFRRSGLHDPKNLKMMEKSIQDAQNGLCEPVNPKILEKTQNSFHEPISINIMEKTVQDCTRNGFHGHVNFKIPEKTVQDCARNRFHEPVKLNIPENIQDCSQNEIRNAVNLQISVPYGSLKNRNEQSSVSSITDTSSKNKIDNNGTNDVLMQNFQSYPLQVPVFAGPTWPYNTGQWVPPPGVYPMPFYPPPPYWGCATQPHWTLPWVTMPLSSPVSPTLGKHSRDEDSSRSRGSGEGEDKRESGSEPSLWVPKTLRIDDPGEAAKSSIWATLGIKHDGRDIARKGSLFKAFKSRADEDRDNSDNLPVLLANPAALSRSRNFQESS